MTPENMLDRFVVFQSLSSVFLVAACLNFKGNVDTGYTVGAWCNALVSFVYNGIQVPCEETYSAAFGEVSCSYIEHKGDSVLGLSMKLWKSIDLFFVCFICLFTGCYGSETPLLAVAFVCGIGAYFGQIGAGLVVGLAFALTLGKLHRLNKISRRLFWTGAVAGPAVFVLSPKDRWPCTYRAAWHFCCMLLVYTGSLLNVTPKESVAVHG